MGQDISLGALALCAPTHACGRTHISGESQISSKSRGVSISFLSGLLILKLTGQQCERLSSLSEKYETGTDLLVNLYTSANNNRRRASCSQVLRPALSLRPSVR